MKNESSNIINKLKNGNSEEKENAFKILINKYKHKLYWHIRKIVIDHDDANDEGDVGDEFHDDYEDGDDDCNDI